MSVAALAAGLAAQGRASRQRRALILAGGCDWTRATALSLLAGAGLEEVVWITDAPPPGARSLQGAQARQLLGGEREAVVFDLYAGLDVEALGAVAGVVRAGGLLLLLAPERTRWVEFDDPEQGRITVHPVAPVAVSRRFMARFERELNRADVTWVEEGKPLPPLPAEPVAVPPLSPDARGCLTHDQHRAVEAIIALAGAADPAPLVITSDRGRGKSAALGLAAAALLEEGHAEIVVTAPRFDAAAVVFLHAQCHLPAAQRARDLLRHRDARLRFAPPDALGPLAPGSLLLVDEAAALPAPLLDRIIADHRRVVFATTVHGYEGSGRGFATRFQSLLDARAPGWRALELEQPVRWAVGDPVEQLIFRALLLDGSPAEEALARRATAAACTIERLDRDRLAGDEALLGELFGLLVLAHYRTSPLDLRFLLDGPNLAVWVARHEGHLIGAALVAEEGGFDPPLARAVWEGRRRPRGHLLAQSLAVHAGLEEAPTLRYHRVVRIAVHPAAQGRGIGGRLLAEVERAARAAGADALGSSFGASPALIRFWSRHGLHPVRLGVTLEASSGAPAVMVLRPLSERGAALYREARARFLDLVPHLLVGSARGLPPPLSRLLELRRPDDPPPLAGLDRRDWQELAAYAAGRRDLELVQGALHRLLDDEALASLDDEARELVEMRVGAARPWAGTVAAFGFRGKSEAAEAVRAALRAIILARGGVTVREELARIG
jgi:tRNA(Met) cytidine acetyltransferase